MFPHPVPPTALAKLSLIIRQVPNQLGHLFWMSLLSVGLVGFLWPWQVGLTVMGVELMSFCLHQMDEHPKDGWLAMPSVFFTGIAAAVAGFYLLGWPFFFTQVMTIIGTQIFSFAIHRLQPAHRQGHWHDNVAWMMIGLTICAFPLTFQYTSSF